LTLELRRLRQARRGHRVCPPIEVFGSALEACREMQYFLSGIGELT
jgi:hypothetical protein